MEFAENKAITNQIQELASLPENKQKYKTMTGVGACSLVVNSTCLTSGGWVQIPVFWYYRLAPVV